MRTTVRLDDALLDDAKRYAAEQGITLTRLLEEALRERLARRAPPPEAPPFRLVTVTGRMRPGLDLDDNAALRDRMEEQ